MLDLVRGLPSRGFDVHVALQSPGPVGALLDESCISWTPMRTHRWIGSPRGPLRRARNRLLDGLTAKKIGALARSAGAALVHTNTLSSPVGALIAKEAGLPHVWHMREAVDTEPGSVFSDGMEAAERFIDGHSDAVLCISDFLAESTARYVSRGKIRRIYNGPLDARRANEAPPERRAIDPKGEINLLLVGAISSRKGQETAIRAMSLLRKEGLDVRLVLAGTGSRAQTERCLAVAMEVGVGAHVSWVGYVDPERLYQTADVSLVCGAREPFGRVAVESLASGIPTVGLRSGATPEIVDHGETGWLYDRDEPECLAAILESAIMTETSARSSMAIEGRRRMYERFNTDRYVGEIVSQYAELGITA